MDGGPGRRHQALTHTNAPVDAYADTETHTYIYAFVSGLINHHDLIFIPSAFISLQAHTLWFRTTLILFPTHLTILSSSLCEAGTFIL